LSFGSPRKTTANLRDSRLIGAGRTTVFTAFGMRGKPSRDVVSEVVNLAKDFLASGAAVDRFLADQLLIYMAMGCHFAQHQKQSARQSAVSVRGYTTNELSTHLLTNVEIIRKFLPVDFILDRQVPPLQEAGQEGLFRVSCHPV